MGLFLPEGPSSISALKNTVPYIENVLIEELDSHSEALFFLDMTNSSTPCQLNLS